MTALDRLIEAVEAGEFPADMSGSDCGIPLAMPTLYRAFSGSMDAAIFVKDTLLPDWSWVFSSWGAGHVSPADGKYSRRAAGAEVKDNPARALLLATLKAYREKQDDK